MYEQFWKDTLVSIKKANGHIIGNCPICGELKGHFYANIQNGLWDCKKCQAFGNAWRFLRDHGGMDGKQIVDHFAQYKIKQEFNGQNQDTPKPKSFSKQAVELYCSKLSDQKLAEFALERGLSNEILKKYGIGINESGEFTLPVKDEHGVIRNILRKKEGGSTISSKDADGVLFGVEDLISGNEVHIVEGAWSALALKERGYKAVGTCGAGVLKDEQVYLFKDKEVYIIPDNDDAGRSGAEKIVKRLKEIAKSICIVNLLIPEKNDVRNFFKDGGTAEHLDSLVKQARITALNLPLSLPEFLQKDIPPVEYVVADIIQKRGKGMVSASPNIGKSIFVQNMALAVACGAEIFMNKFALSPAKVLYLDLEMGEPALKDRFKKISSVRVGSLHNLFIKYIPSLDLLSDEGKKLIEQWLTELRVDVLILDPLGNAWSGDESKQDQVGQLTTYLNTLIEKFGISVLVVHHWRKATREFKSGGQMAAGSYKWLAWLDCHVTLEGLPTGVTISSQKNRNRPRFSPILARINEEILSFEFITDIEKKYNETTLVKLFDSFEAETVSIPELKKKAKAQGGPAETTLLKIISKTTLFEIDKSRKTHFLIRKGSGKHKDDTDIGWKE